MSTITDIKFVLSQRAFGVFCEKLHIPEEVHPVLPDRDITMHERPARKIGLYTRFFDFANFRLPLSTFLVDILRNFCINISQLSVTGAAKERIFKKKAKNDQTKHGMEKTKSIRSQRVRTSESVSHFEILCRVCGITPTVGLFRCFYVNSKKNRWISFIKRSEKSPVDEFACPARFPWHTAKNVTRDLAPKAIDFSAQDYAILIDYPSPFQKFPEEFLFLVGLSRHYTLDEETYPSFVDRDGEDMDIFAFIHTLDPTKVKVVERERHEGEPQLLEVTVGRTVPLLPVAPDCGESELATSVDKLFDEEGSGTQVEQEDFDGGGDGKRKTVVVDTGRPSHPPKKLREDYEILGGPSIAGKSSSAVQRLLAGAVLNAEVRGEPIPALPFVTSSVSATPEREEGYHIDSMTRLNHRTVSAPQRFVISSDSSHHSGANIAEAEVDSFARPYVPILTAATTVTLTSSPVAVVQEKTVKPSMFAADSSFAGRDPNDGVFLDLTGSDFLVSAARQVSLSTKVRMRTEYNIKEKRKLKTVVDEHADLLKVREGEIESPRAQLLLKEAEAAKAIRLHAEASSFVATEKSLLDEVNALNGRNLIREKERDALDVKVTDLETVIVSKERELFDSNAQLTCIKSQNDNLANQDERMKIISNKLEKLDTDLVEMALHLEEKFYPHLLTVIAGRKWLLTHGMELATVKYLNSLEYLSTLGEAISKAIEKGMQDGLAAGITHGQEGRVLTDVAAYNPSAEADYISALQQLQSVNFSLLAELKSNKDASVETIIKILRLEESLAERLGLTGSQPHVDQLMVPIHHSPDQHVVGAFALSLLLDVSSSRVWRIKENIAHHRSALRDIFVPLSEPLSLTDLTGTKSTSEVMPVTTAITTALSVTSASASLIYPISTDDYEVVPAAGQEGVGADANPFLNVDDDELNIQ
ncbi:hypothetical protein Tco_0353072 [Tanacetum coccineum]